MNQLILALQGMAESNKELAAAVAAPTNVVPPAEGAATTTTNPPDVMANVALTNIKVPMDMGENAEERLVNFHEWTEEVNDKLKVAGVHDKKLQTTIALMWGGKEIKTYAVEKAAVKLEDTTTGGVLTDADTWEEATNKIEMVMEGGINEAFAMFKFRQQDQGQRNMGKWYKQLKSSVKTLRLARCTCGHGYTEDRAIRDVMIELTNDSKLRKDGLSKDLQLADVLKEGEANELARSRAATVEGKSSVNKVTMPKPLATNDDGPPTEEEEKFMIARLKKTGRYSIKADKQQQKTVACDRCINARKPHTSNECYFRDKKCRVCNEMGHMGGSKKCSATEIREVEVIDVETDADVVSRRRKVG